MYEIITLDTPGLGDRSYILHDGRVAVVIDPQRDLDRILDLVEDRDLTVTHVLETHIHNDYVSGGPVLVESTGATYVVNALDPVDFARFGVTDGDVIEISGAWRIRVLATPGHTYTHLAFAAEVDGDVVGVFTGGSLLYGSTGRPDLLGVEHADELARHQYASAHRLVSELPADSALFPTHGFGSFCSATQSDGLSSTLGHEHR
ncbi:MAG: MBL fold metallo-hydrolase, partial [Acidimicrobiaceae bacterium]|nr:MBL fold metallo-hydrolase [Acidimicrobiaceae bacterium]